MVFGRQIHYQHTAPAYGTENSVWSYRYKMYNVYYAIPLRVLCLCQLLKKIMLFYIDLACHYYLALECTRWVWGGVNDWPRLWLFLYPPSLFIQSMDLVSLSHWFFMGRLKRSFNVLFQWIKRSFFSCPHEQHTKNSSWWHLFFALLRLKFWDAVVISIWY